MASKQSTAKTEEKTDESQEQEPKEQIKRPAKSGSSNTSSQKSSGQNEKADNEASFSPIQSEMFETIRSFFEETMNSPVRVTAIMDAGDGWNIEVELVEEKEYTQKYGRDQLIGIYEATMNKDQKITSYQRMNTRPRSTPFEKKER